MQQYSPLPLSWWFKFFLTIAALIFGILYTLPSFLFQGSQKETHSWLSSLLPESRINLGLDLKGGVSLTLNVDTNQALSTSIGGAISRAKESLNEKNIKTGALKIQEDGATSLVVNNPEQIDAVRHAIASQTNLLLFEKWDAVPKELKFIVNRSALSDFNKLLMQQAMNTIRNRIDQFGVSEPSIFQSGDTRIMVELPGITDMERAKALLGNTAQLDFRLVLNKLPPNEIGNLIEETKKSLKISENDNSPSVLEKVSQTLRDQGKIPANSTLLLQRELTLKNTLKSHPSSNLFTPFLVEAHPKLTGDLIEDAQAVQTSRSFVPGAAVSLKFKPQGARIFGELTTEAFKPTNAPNLIAIILDGNVESAPKVNEPILGGNASIEMGNRGGLQNQMQEAQDLALVLRSGALPASVKILEERQIGPNEGAQNIRAGIISTVLSAFLVVVLMLIIYGTAGLVANVGMLLNVLIIFAFMALLGATLTLPGIAGIVLTMAIAVDGNVVINERIREEMRLGLNQKQSFYKGYQTSFRTLIDAHITSAVAGFVLLIYGNPTVKGFAVTLILGIICTLFTSYYVTEVIGQWLIEKTNLKRFG